jgi:hypothetical protein
LVIEIERELGRGAVIVGLDSVAKNGPTTEFWTGDLQGIEFLKYYPTLDYS